MQIFSYLLLKYNTTQIFIIIINNEYYKVNATIIVL